MVPHVSLSFLPARAMSAPLNRPDVLLKGRTVGPAAGTATVMCEDFPPSTAKGMLGGCLGNGVWPSAERDGCVPANQERRPCLKWNWGATTGGVDIQTTGSWGTRCQICEDIHTGVQHIHTVVRIHENICSGVRVITMQNQRDILMGRARVVLHLPF